MPDRYMVADVVKIDEKLIKSTENGPKLDRKPRKSKKTGKYLKTRNPNVKRGASQTHATWLAYKIS
jgi:hypothetical protein